MSQFFVPASVVVTGLEDVLTDVVAAGSWSELYIVNESAQDVKIFAGAEASIHMDIVSGTAGSNRLNISGHAAGCRIRALCADGPLSLRVTVFRS